VEVRFGDEGRGDIVAYVAACAYYGDVFEGRGGGKRHFVFVCVCVTVMGHESKKAARRGDLNTLAFSSSSYLYMSRLLDLFFKVPKRINFFLPHHTHNMVVFLRHPPPPPPS